MLEHFGIKDIVDILLVAIVMFQLYKLVSKSGSKPIFNGVLAFLVIWIVSQIFEMRLLGAILDKFVNLGLIILIIIFQDETRHFLMSLGSSRTVQFFARVFRSSKKAPNIDSSAMSLVLACMNMSKSNTGALIVIEQDMNLREYERTGELINADLSTRLLENIFFKNTPLHDGAVIVSGDKIKAAACILPISHSQELPKHFGLRHRAALGITEKTDAKVIIVSEERGKISYASRGELQSHITSERLQKLLTTTESSSTEE